MLTRGFQNTCYLYPSVLIVEAFVALLSLIEQDKLPGVFSADFCSRLAVALFQACLRPLFDQQSDGSWNQSVEETAYGVLILSEARHVCFFNDIRQPLDNAINRGVVFIQSAKETPASYIWIEKVSYASPVLTESYRLAALKATSATPLPGTIGSSVWQMSPRSSTEQQVQQLFAKADLSRTHPEWEMRGSAIETALLVPLLRERLSAVLQSDDEQFASLILLFWTSANNRERTFASAARVFETSLLSALSFQLERAVKASLVPTFEDHMQQLRRLVGNAFSESPKMVGHSNGYASVLGGTHATAPRALADQAT